VSDKLTREIKIKLSVDGKEVTGVLNITDEKLQQLAKNYTKYKSETETASKSTNTFALVLDQFKNELVEVSGTSENLTESVSDFIRMNGLSENQIADVINVLKQEKAALGVNTVEYQKYNQAIETITQAYGHARTGSGALTNTMKGTSSGVQAMSQTMGQLGWAIGDADMFLVNFRMGMMSIGNNIPMIAQGFGYVRDKIKDTGETMKDVLVGAIKGPGGVMIAINGLMFLINALAFLWDKQKKQVKENAEEVKNLASEYENLSTAKLREAETDIRTQFEKKASKEEGQLFVNKVTGLYEVTGSSEEFIEEVDKVNERLKVLKDVSQNTQLHLFEIYGGGKLESISDIDKAIQRLSLEFKDADNQSLRDSIDSKIKYLENLKKQYEGDSSLKDDLIRTDEDIRREIELTKQAIAQTESDRERYLLKQKLRDLLIEISFLSEKIESRDISIKTNEVKNKPPKELDEVPEITKPEIYENAAEGIDTMTTSAYIFNNAIERAGMSTISQMTGVVRIFRQANSVAQIFLNSLGQIALQMTAWGVFKGAISLINGDGFLGGFLGALGIESKAEGGLVVGPGTETSDSIPSMLSNGEFVVKAKATSAFLPMLEAINNFDKVNVKPIINKFANGGLVGRSSQIINAFNNSNSKGSVNNINLVGELKVGLRELRLKLKRLDDFEKSRT
jgi:hypothetical protein